MVTMSRTLTMRDYRAHSDAIFADTRVVCAALTARGLLPIERAIRLGTRTGDGPLAFKIVIVGCSLN